MKHNAGRLNPNVLVIYIFPDINCYEPLPDYCITCLIIITQYSEFVYACCVCMLYVCKDTLFWWWRYVCESGHHPLSGQLNMYVYMRSSSSLDRSHTMCVLHVRSLCVRAVCIIHVHVTLRHHLHILCIPTYNYTSYIQDNLTVVIACLTLSADCHTARWRWVETGQGKFCALKAEGLEVNAWLPLITAWLLSIGHGTLRLAVGHCTYIPLYELSIIIIITKLYIIYSEYFI